VGVTKQQAGIRGEFLAPFLGAFFIYILTSNLIGLVPFSFAITAQLAVTLSMALTVNIGFFILGFYKNKITFLKLFVPSGVPSGVLPLIVVIEVVSYLLRTFSLSVRLFANIMAGHTLLHILASFVVRFITNESYVLAALPGALVLAVTALEFAIAFLQAYVFLVLCSIYYNDALHPAH
jgi:F-type H+-transporting ATPase subunit a